MPRQPLSALVLVTLVFVASLPLQGADLLKLGDSLITFNVQVEPEDPFDTLNKAGKAAQPLKVRRGEVIRVTVVGTPKAGYHTYPVKRVLPTQSAKSMLQIGGKETVPLPPLIESEPKRVEVEGEGPQLQYDERFTWSQDVLISDAAAPGKLELPVNLFLQICDEKNCNPVTEKRFVALEVSPDAPLPLSEELRRRLEEASPKAAPAPAAPTKAAEPARGEDHGVFGLISATAEQYRSQMAELAKRISKPEAVAVGAASNDLWNFILAGIFWGAVSLITPCVFPMIPITVSFFLKQSEKEHHRPLAMATVYSLTIVIVLTLAAAFLLSVFRWLSVHPATNYFLGGLFIFFALSLFGMYEIELPSGLARFTSSREGQGGLVGTMFMALTFTIISFACVAPFLGGFGGTAAAARPLWHNLLGGLAFSCTFAAPFFLLALFPTLLRALPKSGAWLNAVKVVMGFLELAAAFKFFRAAELVQTAGAPSFFTYDLVLGLWVALCVLSGLYLIGLFRLPHDTPQENIGVPRLLFSVAFLCLGLYLTPALFKMRPGGVIYAWVDSFLLPEAVEATGGMRVTANLPYAVAEALKSPGKRLFIDFTGVTCTNCKINEKSVFTKPDIRKLFQNYVVVQIYTDIVPKEFYAGEVTEARANDDAKEINLPFQRDFSGGNEQLPLYAVLEPQADGPIAVVGVYDEGRINNEPAFAEFLREPEKWRSK
jgi:thiol:disulfide interchange protein